jgi:hypothetical protein
MYTDPLGPESITTDAEHRLTALGLLCCGVLVALGIRYDLLVRLFTIHPAVSLCVVFVLLGMALMAWYGLGNAWRLARRGQRVEPFGEIDLGWGGAMGHCRPADEDALCGLMQAGDGAVDSGGDFGGD